MRDLGDNKDEHEFCDEPELNFMLMEWSGLISGWCNSRMFMAP